MNGYLNYLLEASIGLCLFLLVYQVFLRKETSFRLNRIFLLIAILASVTFPLLKFNTVDSPVPSLNFSTETSATNITHYELGESITEVNTFSFSAWEIFAMLYAAGLACFLVVFMIRLFRMIRVLNQTPTYKYHDHNIIEMKSNGSPFSFFHYIFIGATPPLTEKEKLQIIEHESIHAKLYHSFDIVVLNILGIIFWFNPLIRIYKKIFIQLHEFEADARAAENKDVDAYCSLLAKVALYSADYKLANHFSNSLTLKRIEMMRTLKHKIQRWKVIAAAMFLPILFVVVACQDQVETPQNAPTTLLLQKSISLKVTKEVARLKNLHPEDEFIVISPDGHDPKDFEGEHAKHISTVDGNVVFEANAITVVEDGKDESGKPLRYMILQYTHKQEPSTGNYTTKLDEVREEPVALINGEPILAAVDKPAEAPDGYVAFNKRLDENRRYPDAARKAGLEGAVFVKLVVTKDGALTNFEIVRGVSKEIDAEAIRLIKSEAQRAWKPGMQNGKPVHSTLVLPVLFKLNP